MTKVEYLIELAKGLEALGVNKDELYPETRRLVGFYQEMIEDRMEDGLSEEDAVAGMEKIPDIVERARREFSTPEIVVGPDADEGAPCETREPRESARAEGKFTRMTREFDAKGVARVMIADQNRSIQVRAGDVLAVEYVDGPDGHYDVDLSGGELTVRFIPEPFGFRSLFGSIRPQDSALTLTLPARFAGEVEARTSNGSMTASDLNLEGNLLLRSSNGKITAERVSARKVKLVTSNGGIRLRGVSAESVTAQSSNARIESERVSGGEVTLSTSNGANEAREVGGGSVHIETRNGHVSVERVSGDAVSLSSSNGAISGSILGRMEDYAITSRTSNGKNNLPPVSQGKKTLDVRTSNARIDISFEK